MQVEREPEVAIQRNAPIRTWFGVGGGAGRFAVARDERELSACLRIDPALRILGDGANLLIDDGGVEELVVSLAGDYERFEADPASGRVFAGAGVKLPRLINETVRLGLGGLEVLAGIPAQVGGALIMNAGGSFGQIADTVRAVHALDRAGRPVLLGRDEIPFAYRESGLGHLVLTGAEFALTPVDPGPLRERMLGIMAYKKNSQPLKDDSAGCVFKNPLLRAPLFGQAAGERISAGMLIDRAGCKGLSVGGAAVSDVHANFIVTSPGARARDVIDLMEQVSRRVMAEFGVALEREVVVWQRREPSP